MRSIDILYRYAEEDAEEDEKLAEMDEQARKKSEGNEDEKVSAHLSVPKVVVMTEAEDSDEHESVRY